MDREKKPSLDEVIKDPVEEAAKEFSILNYQFGKLVDGAKGMKSVKRVLKQVAEYPLGPQAKPKLLNHQENLMFDVFQELMKHKQVIINATVKQIMDKQELLTTSNPGEKDE